MLFVLDKSVVTVGYWKRGVRLRNRLVTVGSRSWHVHSVVLKLGSHKILVLKC